MDSTQSTEITIAQRAVLAINMPAGTEQSIARYAEAAALITAVGTQEEYENAEVVRKNLKKIRTTVTRQAKEARDDARKFAQAVVDEERRLIGLISPQEDRIRGLTGEWEEKEARERAEREKKERERILAITTRINNMRSAPGDLIGRPSSEVSEKFSEIEATEIHPDVFGEFVDEALDAKIAALEKLSVMIRDRKAYEESLEMERAAARQAEEARKAARKIEDEERKRAANSSATMSAGPAVVSRRPVTRHPEIPAAYSSPPPVAEPPNVPPANQADAASQVVPSRPSDEEILAALAERFEVAEGVVVQWLIDMDLALLIERHPSSV